MKRIFLTAVLLLSMGLPRQAHAECAVAYTPGQLTDDMAAMTQALRNLDEATFMRIGKEATPKHYRDLITGGEQ